MSRFDTIVGASSVRLGARAALVGLALSAAVAAVRAETSSPAGDMPTLYTRLGGYEVITRFVDTAFPRVASQPQLRRFFQGHSRDSQLRQRQLIVDALCHAAGGPCAYTGRTMKTVHTGLGITAADWKVFEGILGGALEELKVPPRERTELLELLERRFRPDVVEDR